MYFALYVPITLFVFFLFVLFLFSCFVRFAFCFTFFFCIVLCLVTSHVELLFYICVQVYCPLPRGENPVAVNKYHITFFLS
jgi:hypothetical protein